MSVLCILLVFLVCKTQDLEQGCDVVINGMCSMGMNFSGEVRKRVWKMSLFGQDLENQAAHPHQDFPGVPPPPSVPAISKRSYFG